ncbi:DUF6542 domain-containing protein [Aeromicrobium sp.]|uniref:DUF6542 domain-containing protein n=1 Tax=Aeromicrobium sp. TaxID=1871063 RepID=UPI0019A315CA|nr:DUF6542 domain-containing protein [Aeromicrobium sp.]MBC7633489.1 hypothetical protein [Aeromicrobium sp.]
MSQAVSHTPASLAQRDLSARQAVVAASVAMSLVIWLDLRDGHLGLLLSVAFVLIAVTVPLSVDVRSLFPTGVLPPALFVGTLLVVCLVAPSAIRVDGLSTDAGLVGRLIAAMIDRGMTLVIGHALALSVIALRILSDSER